VNKEGTKLIEYLYKVQQDTVKSEKYSRLLNSNMDMTALHEAAHAVIGVSLGARVTDAWIGLSLEHDDDGITAWQGGLTNFNGLAAPNTFAEKVIVGAILMASRLTESYKFEWQVERHLGGFEGDERMLESFCGEDEHILYQANAFLHWAFDQALIIHRIERVAAILSKDKIISGSDIARIIFEIDHNELGGLDFTSEAPLRFQEFIPAPDGFRRKENKEHCEQIRDRATVVKAPITTIIGFQLVPKTTIPLRIVSFEVKVEKTGEIQNVVAGPELALDKFEEFGVQGLSA
jgi:hypothetical protein